MENKENVKNEKKLGIEKWEIMGMRIGMLYGNHFWLCQTFGLDKLSVRFLLIYKIYSIKQKTEE